MANLAMTRLTLRLFVVKEKRACSTRKLFDKNACLFCEEHSGILHEFRTMDADTNVRNMATDLQDTTLLAKIGGGYLHVLEANYHMA